MISDRWTTLPFVLLYV